MAQGGSAVELTAGERPLIVEGAKACHRIQGDTRSVGALVHAPLAVPIHHVGFWDRVSWSECDDPVAATTTAGAGWGFWKRIDGRSLRSDSGKSDVSLFLGPTSPEARALESGERG